jgi:hypothetical protein
VDHGAPRGAPLVGRRATDFGRGGVHPMGPTLAAVTA